MRITYFASRVAEREGKKIGVSIAQISEVLRVVNDLTGGALYAIIRLMR